jgi:hypothetical membrane protein
MFISLSINSAPEFSWMENALSDLGVMLGVTSVLFNYGLIISGILGFIFATSLFRVLRFEINRGLGGALIFSLACLALIAIGVFPENVRYVHYFASVAFFVLLMGSLLRMGLAFWFMRKKPMAVFTLVLAVIAVVPWLLLFLVRYVSGVAIPELISAVAGGVWTATFGYKMLKMASQSNVP